MRSNCGEYGIETLVGKSGFDIVDLAVQLQCNAHVEDALYLVIKHIPWQPIFRNAETHHAAGHGTGLADGHLVAQPG